MVEQDAVAGIHVVRLAVVHRDPVGIELGHAVGAARVEGSGFFLRSLLHFAVKLTSACLIDPSFCCQPQHAHCFQKPQRAKCIAVGGVLGSFKAHRHMALSTQVINFIGLHLLDDPELLSVRSRNGALDEDRSRAGLMR